MEVTLLVLGSISLIANFALIMDWRVQKWSAWFWKKAFEEQLETTHELVEEAYRRGMQLRTDVDGMLGKAKRKAKEKWN